MPRQSVVCLLCHKEQRGSMIRHMRRNICKGCRLSPKENTVPVPEPEVKENNVEEYVEHVTPVKQRVRKRKIIEILPKPKIKGAAAVSPRQLRRRSGELSKVIEALAGPGEKNQIALVSNWMKRKKRFVEQ